MHRSAPAWIALLVVLTACRRSETGAAAAAGPAVAVHVAVVAAEKLPVFLEVPATVRPADRSVISAKLTGTIATLPWGLGQQLHAGDVLLTLSAPDAEARLRQAQAQASEAQRGAERERTLVAKGVDAADVQRDAEDRLRYAQAAVAEAEAMLAYASVRAPFDGVITEKNVLPGDLATPGLPLLVLESTQHLRAEGTIPERLAAGLNIGGTLNVMVDENAPVVRGTIEELSGSADAVSRSVLAKIALPAGSARSGQFVRLQVPAGESQSLMVPAEAVNLFGQMERVFVVEQGHAVLRLVKTGRREGARIEVLSGLTPGETVVVSPPAALREGVPLEPGP